MPLFFIDMENLVLNKLSPHYSKFIDKIFSPNSLAREILIQFTELVNAVDCHPIARVEIDSEFTHALQKRCFVTSTE